LGGRFLRAARLSFLRSARSLMFLVFISVLIAPSSLDTAEKTVTTERTETTENNTSSKGEPVILSEDSMILRLATLHENARSALECGSGAAALDSER
jgi:hypothetical protein